jgi:HSP20 family molecular chaperone IbpA
MFCSIR